MIVAKTADHLPLHRQEKIFERHGVDISPKTMGGWLAQCADLLKPLDGSMKEVLFEAAQTTSFVVAQSKFLLQFLIISFDDPAMFAEVYEFRQGDMGRKSG